MKKILLLITICVVSFISISVSVSYGQSSADSIIAIKQFGGYQFFQGGTRLNLAQVARVMEPNEQAYKEIKEAQATNTLASIIGGVGGFMVGWPIGTALGGGEPNWTMAGIGAGLIIISIPLSQKYNRQAISAVDTFNMGLNTTSFRKKPELNLGYTGNGIGIIMRF